ncbi:MAG: hypothetical protein ACREOQ_22995 [Gemmatimonadales bacterium]
MPARFTIRPLIAVLLTLSLAACMTWKRSDGPAPAVIAGRPALVRIVQSDNRTVELRRPWLEGDSIIGYAGPSGKEAKDGLRTAVAASDVKQLSVRGVSAGKTVALLGGLGATAILVAAAASGNDQPASTGGGSSCGQDCLVSCPLVYSWDGRAWRLDSGTFGGAIMAALMRTDVDNLDYAVPDGDSLRLRVTNELNETDHIDALRVLAVDHDGGVTVAPGSDGTLYSVGTLQAPLEARELGGPDVLARVSAPDGWSWESAPLPRDTTLAVRDGITLAFRRVAGASSARLVLDAHNTAWASHLMEAFIAAHGRETDAWYDSLAADPSRARRAGADVAREAFLSVSVLAGGRWIPQGVAWEAGPEIVKRQVVPIDLRGVSSDSIQVRLESPPGFWLIDAAALDFSAEQALEVHDIAPSGAVDRERRDVRALLSDVDGHALVAERGDAADLVFALPPLPAGKARTYMLSSTGWYHVHTPSTGEPDRETIARIEHEPGAISRLATARFDAAIAAAGRPR